MSPPRVAMWLLARLHPDREPLVGDLLEEWHGGRSTGWFWRQTMRALFGHALHWARARRSLAALSLVAVGLYWLGTLLPVPGVNSEALARLTGRVPTGSSLAMYDLFTGGNLRRVTIFALGIMPYVSALVIAYVAAALGLGRGWGARGRRALRWSVWGVAVGLSVVQAAAVAVFLERLTAFSAVPVVAEPGWSFRLTLVLILTGTTASLIWLSDAITRRRIGRGVTLLFFAGLAAGLPGAASAIGAQIRAGYVGPGDLALLVVGLVVSSVLVVLVDPARWGRLLSSDGKAGGMRHGTVMALSCALAVLLAGSTAHAQLEIRAASSDATSGWIRMDRPGGDGPVWVAPTPSLTRADIASVEERREGAERQLAVGIELTDAGAAKMRQLSAAQLGKPIAMVLDGQLIWAPVVRSEISREVLITGGPNGLTPDTVTRIIAAVNAP